MKRALILVDIQNDFLPPHGALAVPCGDRIIPLVNELQKRFDLVVATQDWHPVDHMSFAANHPGKSVGDKVVLDGLDQILWPAHCVQGTPGAELAPALDKTRIARVFQKGNDSQIDSYSGFYDNGQKRSTGLGEYLREQGVTEVVIVGLATDYCVRFTALDAKRLGFHTVVVEDACRGVCLNPDDIEDSLSQMRLEGINVVQSKYITDDVGQYEVFDAETGY